MGGEWEGREGKVASWLLGGMDAPAASNMVVVSNQNIKGKIGLVVTQHEHGYNHDNSNKRLKQPLTLSKCLLKLNGSNKKIQDDIDLCKMSMGSL